MRSPNLEIFAIRKYYGLYRVSISSSSYWLKEQVNDPRVRVREYSYFDRLITFSRMLWLKQLQFLKKRR